MIEAKVHDLCGTLVGVAVSFIYVTFYAIKWLVHWETTSWGCVLHDYKRNVIDSQSKNCDREEAR